MYSADPGFELRGGTCFIKGVWGPLVGPGQSPGWGSGVNPPEVPGF